MTALFGKKSVIKHETKFGKYGNPFELSGEQRRHIERQRLEAMAHLVKRHNGDKRPVEEIAADLSLWGMRKK